MKLLPKALEAKLPPLYSQDGKGDTAIAYVKFFTPDANWTWYASEYDPAQRLFFGLVDGFESELGYFSLDELENIVGPLGLKVERDLWFEPMALTALLPQRR